MKLLFMPYPSASGTWDCTVYMVAIVQEARRRGHEVLFHACPPSSRLLTDNMFAVRHFTGAVANTARSYVADIYDVFTLLDLDDAGYWHHLMELEQEVIRELCPDAVIADMRPTATLSALRSGIPLACMASVGTDPRTQSRPNGHPLDDLALAPGRECLGRSRRLRDGREVEARPADEVLALIEDVVRCRGLDLLARSWGCSPALMISRCVLR